MVHRLLFFFLCLIAGHFSPAQAMPTGGQVLPLPGARLNYTQVMFEYEQVRGAAMYLVQIAVDTPRSSFDHCLIEQRDPATATMISSLEWGRNYKWRYAGLPAGQAGIIDGQPPVWHGPWQFGIDSGLMMRARLFNLTVTTDDSANAGGLIVNDGTFTIIDRTGRIVWYLPRINWRIDTHRASVVTDSTIDQVMKMGVKPQIFDLRLNPYGTITYMTDSDIVECDLTGHELWQKHVCDPPSEMGENYYNHVFMRLPDGHYMTLGGEVWRKMPAHIDSALALKKYSWRDTVGGTEYARVDFGTVLEYDKAGNVVWTWNSEDYFDRYGSAIQRSNMELKAHINALSVDRRDEFVYVGFRDISRIVKVEKSTGHVVDSWGEQATAGVGPIHQADIHMQHDATILDDGNILVFDNNDYPGSDSIPRVVIFSQQAGQAVWSYDYDIPPAARGLGRSRGNASLLRNGNILACSGTVGTIFEVTKDKKIVWEARLKLKDFPGYDFQHIIYRAYNISSLYPCYFTCTTDEDTLAKHSHKASITIFNKGSEEDAYDIEVSEQGPQRPLVHSPILKPNTSMSFEISDIQYNDGHRAYITVRSRTNPDLVRKSVVWYR